MVCAASFFTASCIVPDAPEYGVANETPVFVVESTISPNPQSLQHYDNVPGIQSPRFSFQVRSEDAPDDGLVSALYIDYKHTGAIYIDHKNHKPSTLDVERLIQWELHLPNTNISPGCHIITITVLHAKGWDENNSEQIGTPPDLTAVSWFASFDDDGNTTLLSSCPDASTESSTPGP
jgi:hypothetical protein